MLLFASVSSFSMIAPFMGNLQSQGQYVPICFPPTLFLQIFILFLCRWCVGKCSLDVCVVTCPQFPSMTVSIAAKEIKRKEK